MATYAIGDLQGCFTELQNLLKLINFNSQHDALWFAGDLINRGPNNLETIQFIRSLPHTKIVLGNHDLHFLAVATGVAKTTRGDTLDDLLDAPALPDIINWMRQLPLAYFDSSFNYLLVHAGIPPIWHVSEALQYAEEVANILKGNNYQEFLTRMYGNLPDLWCDSLHGWERLRLITNYLTRIRFCNQQSKIELTHKSTKPPPGYKPWFDFPRTNKERILFGHWAAIEGITGKANIIALDTGCVWGRKLTAFRLDDQQLFSVPAVMPA
ncbi:MAG: symmetrical bis(5'-nucleosyl)-tetraphosphatase [Pseudomonadales bacterium]|nr:symmetrical bis(5'-nucleosyl)-tetraphosphatase [Pseudomonadales bacterium]